MPHHRLKQLLLQLRQHLRHLLLQRQPQHLRHPLQAQRLLGPVLEAGVLEAGLLGHAARSWMRSMLAPQAESFSSTRS